ncbi:hypothetical protein B0H67DRAFT_488130 [Lasiosphaeris hirsuta]|uniref:Kelch repeat-containing protein n=1 Tax=Lasiosphaeris hirsuta TaxID=260670 RepID=A0AA40AFG8_9PEZI|nr:hypothetical protein B0H67DRAFT_488130 [Lasiosphaeris hirsuta]
MLGPGAGLLAAVTAFASVAHGQAAWPADQVNTTICQWAQFRAHVIRDTVYMDGGSLWWLPGLSDGTYGQTVNDHNPLGIVYTLNFSKPFTTTDNITAVFGALSKAAGGSGAANNYAPNYFDGAMLGNDAEFFTYGGMLRQTTSFSDPDKNEIIAFQKYQYGPEKEIFSSGFLQDDLPSDLTRYLAYGGGASAPSENKAWYFSGMHAPGWGPIYEPSFNESLTAINVSSTFITLDMTTQQKETWKNVTLPSSIPGRANPELVWVPVGKEGILVALGGVIFPEFTGYLGTSSNAAASKATSPSFMSTINIYDVASDKWYSQPTVGGPGQLTRGCSVVIPAQDQSSFSIYYYGGYTGLTKTEEFNDDVWVLSIPSFTWVKVSVGTGPGRAGHKCFMPYPDQMFAIGGYTKSSGGALTCLKETVRVFNVSSAAWLKSYDPAKWSNYTIPDTVVSKIGGSPTGGATATTPGPSGWAATDLASVFGEKYPVTKIATYYPYESVAPTNNTNPTLPTVTVEPQSDGGTPAFLGPVLGVVLGLMFLTMIAVLILLWRRRKLLRGRTGMSEAGTEDTNGHRIMSWMRGQNTDGKAGTVTSEETPSSPDDLESVTTHPLSMAEMMNTEIRAPVELMDTSPRVELHDTGLTHLDVMNRYSHLGEEKLIAGPVLNNGSYYSSTGTHQIDHASSISPSSASLGQHHSQHQYSSTELPASSPATYAETPSTAAIANTVESTPTSPAPTGRGYVPSGVSNISERDKAHLRTISDTSVVSSVATGLAAEREKERESGMSPVAESVDHNDVFSDGDGQTVVSPPTAGPGVEAADYVSAGQEAAPVTERGATASGTSPTSPLRRSVFHESREDMNDLGPHAGTGPERNP